MTYLPRIALIAVIGAALTPMAVLADGPMSAAGSKLASSVSVANQAHAEKPSVRNDLLWRVGQQITENHVRLRQPDAFGLKADATYWRSFGYIYEVSPESGEVIAQIGNASDVVGF